MVNYPKPDPTTQAEVAVFVTVYGKTVRALFNPCVQETLISPGVFRWINESSGQTARRVILRRTHSLRMVSSIKMKIGMKRNRQIEIDGVIEDKLKEIVIVLGMRAIRSLGFKFSIGGQEAKMRVNKCVTWKRTAKKVKKIQPVRPKDDDEDAISFLDEEEARRICEWN